MASGTWDSGRALPAQPTNVHTPRHQHLCHHRLRCTVGSTGLSVAKPCMLSVTLSPHPAPPAVHSMWLPGQPHIEDLFDSGIPAEHTSSWVGIHYASAQCPELYKDLLPVASMSVMILTQTDGPSCCMLCPNQGYHSRIQPGRPGTCMSATHASLLSNYLLSNYLSDHQQMMCNYIELVEHKRVTGR